jgi:hypothetical protein
MITDAQRDAAKAHGFLFYERQAGRAPSALELGQTTTLDTYEQLHSTLRHLIKTCHHPAFIAVDLLNAVAEREGTPRFREACAELKTIYDSLPSRDADRWINTFANLEIDHE